MLADYRGARGSTAGDDFHEWWALRHALRLLDPKAGLSSLKVEGVKPADQSGSTLDKWDGVDCTLYFNEDDAGRPSRIIIEQLKYSGSKPKQKWTVPLLKYYPPRKKNTSIIKKLAVAFAELSLKHPGLVSSGNLHVRLVSNQPLGKSITNALANAKSVDYKALKDASGLNAAMFRQFAASLDFSHCGTESRFGQEESVVNTIAELVGSDGPQSAHEFKFQIHRLMLPEAVDHVIYRETLLSWMGVAEAISLLPCPSDIKIVDNSIERDVSADIISKMITGHQYICLHGGGGCGKTTAIQQIQHLLPKESTMIVFDCFGAGHYLESNAYRHHSRDAILHIINEMAFSLQIPFLINRDDDIDYPKIFSRRLADASRVISETNSEALLVIVIDAADCSVIGAENCSPAEPSFVYDTSKIGSLPSNVRILFTTRTARIESLKLPENFSRVELTGFTIEETTQFVRNNYPSASDEWIEDFHKFSNSNPRVQNYAFEYARQKSEDALSYLLPNGKDLDQIFKDRFKAAVLFDGSPDLIGFMCAALISLPAPVSVKHLAAVTNINEERVQDFLRELPGINWDGNFVGLSDEDFEHFIRQQGQDKNSEIDSRIADHMYKTRKIDEYAAKHLATALDNAERGSELIDIIKNEPMPSAISDPIVQREVQRQRLRIAIKVCRNSGSIPEALYTLLVGIEAMKTEEVVQKTIVENLDLAVHLAPNAVRRTVLQNNNEIEYHGQVLFHLLASDANNSDGIAFRDKRRMINEWIKRRKDFFERGDRNNPNDKKWPIGLEAATADYEAHLIMHGAALATEKLRRWRPRYNLFRCALNLAKKLVISGRSDLLRDIINDGNIPMPWAGFLNIALAVAGESIDIHSLEKALEKRGRFRILRPDHFHQLRDNDRLHGQFLKMILDGCEIAIAHGSDPAKFEDILQLYVSVNWRRRDKIHASDSSIIDFGLRAFSLLEHMKGTQPTLESYWIAPPQPGANVSDKKRREMDRDDEDKRRELEAVLRPLIPIYDLRAQIILGEVTLEQVEDDLRKTLRDFGENIGRISRSYHAPGLTSKVAQAITQLTTIPNIDPISVLDLTTTAFKDWPNGFSAGQARALELLSSISGLHADIQSTINTMVSALVDEKTAANEKIDALLTLARIMLPINKDESKSIFKKALNVASDIDVDTMQGIALFAPMAYRAQSCLLDEDKRRLAHRITVITSDAGIRLEGYDHFPWEKATSAIAILDASQALAVVAKWEDSGIASRYDTLSPTIEGGLENGGISSVHATGLLHLVDHSHIDLSSKIVEKSDDTHIAAISEEVARLELLRFSLKGRRSVNDSIISRISSVNNLGYWAKQIEENCTFVEAHGASKSSTDAKSDSDHDSREEKRAQLFTKTDWSSINYTTKENIISLLDNVQEMAKVDGIYMGASEIISEASKWIQPGDQMAFIGALASNELREELSYYWAQSLLDLLDQWTATSLAVSDYMSEYLPNLVQNNLPDFCKYYFPDHWKDDFPELVDKFNLKESDKVELLLAGIEANSERFDVSTLYALVGLISKYIEPQEAATILDLYTNRLMRGNQDQDPVPTDVIPIDTGESFARFMYVYMGDVDVRNRWRAAHAVRCVVRLGESNLLSQLTAHYDRLSENEYRDPAAPFYWIAARLWLQITINRIANESPVDVAPLVPWLIKVATDDEFPHVLIREYAKQTLLSLASYDTNYLTQDQKLIADKINTTSIQRQKDPESYGRVDRFRKKKGRFQFDSMDTIPYWYSRPVRAFANLEQEDFLQVAEAWIIDKWHVKESVWEWNWQKRFGPFSDGDYNLWSHRQGTMPTLERYNNHLEWHAMWCAVGELMQTRALALSEYDDSERDPFEDWLSGEGITAPPQWLSDMRGRKPLERRIWFKPGKPVEKWIDDICDDDFLIELGLMDEQSPIIASGYHSFQSEKYSFHANIASAIVSSKTSEALMRALQSANDSRDYYLPTSEDRAEIDTPPFQLSGWLTYREGDLQSDGKDPFRNGIGDVARRPTDEVIETLGLVYKFDHKPTWVDKNTGSLMLSYEAWGDTPGDQGDRNRFYGPDPESEGWRLIISRQALAKYISVMGMELIAEVQITREEHKDRYSRFDEEAQKEARFAKIVLLKRDGGIYAAEGRIGTWIPPS